MKFILLALSLVCGLGYAAHATETAIPVSNDINVTAPHQGGSWSFAAEALFLQPLNQTFTYADLYTGEGTDEQFADNNSYQNVKPDYHGWFGADISYGFPGNGRDVTLAYEGLYGKDTAHISNDTEGFYSVPDNFGFGGFIYTTGKGEINTHYDAADLLLGQKLIVGDRISLHPFLGLRYAYIDEKDTGVYSSPDNGDDSALALQDAWNSTFKGIGPRFGSDAAINLGQGFSLRGRLGLSALIGSVNPDFNFLLQQYTDDGALISSNAYSSGQGSSRHLIPEMDGRLGLNYSYHFDANLALGIEAGWQVTNYFNVIYQLAGDEEDQTAANTDFGLQGPYARLQLDIA